MGVKWWLLLLYSLGLTHLLWGLSLVLEPMRYYNKPLVPGLFALIHLVISLLIFLGMVRLGCFISSGLLLYYWFFVKPIEPIAEPQSVGIIAISLALFIQSPIPILRSINFIGRVSGSESFRLFLLRLGLAYPFVEWGLDALRNPAHFIAFMQNNYITSLVFPRTLLSPITFILGFYELMLAVMLVLNLFITSVSKAVLFTLIVFILVAGYPLALPQDIVLVAASLVLITHGGGGYSIKRLFSSSS